MDEHAYYVVGIVVGLISVLRLGVVPVINASRRRLEARRQLVRDVQSLTRCMRSLWRVVRRHESILADHPTAWHDGNGVSP